MKLTLFWFVAFLLLLQERRARGLTPVLQHYRLQPNNINNNIALVRVTDRREPRITIMSATSSSSSTPITTEVTNTARVASSDNAVAFATDHKYLSSSVGTTTIKSLAGPYLIDCRSMSQKGDDAGDHSYSWSLYRLPINKSESDDDDNDDDDAGESFQAWQALHSTNDEGIVSNTGNENNEVSAKATIRLVVEKNRTLRVEWIIEDSWSTAVGEQEQGLRSVLEAVAVQWAARSSSLGHAEKSLWQIHRSNGESISFVIDDGNPTSLFGASLGSGVEWVEMVDQRGHVLGRVPRPLVHKHNLLHRGIGMFVTKNESLFQKTVSDSTGDTSTFPDLYVHQRTATKRIFPSLYDMFVGGVSGAGESSRITAQREVAEELGLHESTHLSSEPLLKCVVCTSYNRCVVDLYEYIMDTTSEEVAWQAEEVSWGSFCSYALVEAAANRSIQRLHDRRGWPGCIPFVQSSRCGELSSQPSSSDEWTEWDFVPDGLLVWEAWLRFITQQLE